MTTADQDLVAGNREAVASAYQAMAAGDPRPFLATLADDVVVIEPAGLPHGGTYRGVGEIPTLFRRAASVLAPGEMTVRELTAEGERVVAVLEVGLADGTRQLVSEHWTFQGGRAVELRVFWENPGAASPT